MVSNFILQYKKAISVKYPDVYTRRYRIRIQVPDVTQCNLVAAPKAALYWDWLWNTYGLIFFYIQPIPLVSRECARATLCHQHALCHFAFTFAFTSRHKKTESQNICLHISNGKTRLNESEGFCNSRADSEVNSVYKTPDCPKESKLKARKHKLLIQPRNIKAYGEVEMLAPRIIIVGPTCRWMVSFTFQPL